MSNKKTENEKSSRMATIKDRWNGSLLQKFIASEQGTTAIEYALIAGGISVVIIGSVGILGDTLVGKFEAVESALD